MNKAEFWCFTIGASAQVFGPIDKGRPVNKAEILRYIAKRYETRLKIEAWPVTPWWLA